MNLGKIEKIQITAYTDPRRKSKGKVFKFHANPTQVSSQHQNEFSRLQGINTSGRSARYNKSHSDLLKAQLVIDNSIASDSLVPTPPAGSVSSQLDKFLTTCCYMDGNIHEPRFLRVQWGSIDFSCRLQSVEVKYTRFDKSGAPLRAELDTVFISDMPEAKRIRLENKKSPDITHTRIIRHGDTLPGLCKEIYGDATYYLTVAKANELNHFRRLQPGQEIFFPPLEIES